MKKSNVLFLVRTKKEKEYLTESLRGLAGILPYTYKILQHGIGKATSVADIPLELEHSVYDLVVSAGYGRSAIRNMPVGMLLTPSMLIDVELAQRACIFPEDDIQYKFECVHAGNGGVMICSDKWLNNEEDYKPVYGIIGADVMETASFDLEPAAIAQTCAEFGVPYTVAKLLCCSATCSMESDVSAYSSAPDFLKNFDPVVHYVSEVLSTLG